MHSSEESLKNVSSRSPTVIAKIYGLPQAFYRLWDISCNCWYIRMKRALVSPALLNYIFAWINKKTLILAFTRCSGLLYSGSWGIKVICFLRSHKRRKARQTNWKSYPHCDDDHDHEFKQTYIIFSGTLSSPFTAIPDCYKWERCDSVWHSNGRS